jgi:membrane protein implicated in regulation of membrane protease activity
LWRFWRRLLGWQPGDSLVRLQDLVGQRGRVLLSCSRSLRGLVRLQVRGSLIDSPAYGMDERPLLEGDRVMVLHQQGHDLWVTAISFSDPP